MLFLSSYINKIDKKGRISVPAQFRGVLVKQEFQGIIAFSSLLHPCIEACGMERFAKLNAQIEKLDPFSEEHDAFLTTIFGGSVQLGFDSEGRVMLPEPLLLAAGISEQAVFVGKGETFEIWEPSNYQAHSAKARALVVEKKQLLKGGGGV